MMLADKISTSVNARRWHTGLKRACRRLPLTLGLSLAMGMSCAVYAQEKITLTLNDADIRDLILWAQDVTDKNIIIHPNVKGKVSVLAGDAMNREDAFQVFLSVLQVHGFAAIPNGNTLKIIPDVLAKQSSVPVLQNQQAGTEDVVIRIVKIKNVSATKLINLLRPLVPQVGHLAANPSTNAIIIADRANNIDKVLSIVERIDQVGVVDIELIPLKYASAKSVVELTNKLLPKNQGKGPESQSVTLAVDDRSNSVLLTGDPSSRQQIRNLIKRLDQPLSGEGNTQVVYLNYANAKDMAPILESISGSVQKSEKDNANAKVEVNIQADESLNALVITAPPALLNTMKGVIAKLDVRRAQVLVEALIVEIGTDLGDSLGIEWRSNSDNDLVGGFSSFPSGVTPFGPGTDDSGFELGSGLSLGYFRGGELRAIVNALATNTDTNILSTPTIMTLDNEEAEILVGENVPFITGSQSRDGQSDPFQTIERQDIGISLKVTPRINNDDSVTLTIEQKVETVAAKGEASDITTQKREIQTRVLVGNDDTLVLGGLIRDEVSETEVKVPLLGDIPLLGRLFKSDSSTTVKRNLMVFIHPKIIRDQARGVDISRDHYNRMRDSQAQFRDKVESFFVPRDIRQLPPFQPAAEDTKVEQTGSSEAL